VVIANTSRPRGTWRRTTRIARPSRSGASSWIARALAERAAASGR
jgi:hypothetical protein